MKLTKEKSGKYVKKLRKELGLTQKEMAEIVGILPSNISDLENNRYDISLSKFVHWCNLLEYNDYKKILLK